MKLRQQKLVSLLSAGFLIFGSVGCSSSDPSNWNRKEKGSAIGGLGGAVVGGAIGSGSGNTVGGAALGGLAGAGAGYLIGNEQDKDRDRDRRYRDRY